MQGHHKRFNQRLAAHLPGWVFVISGLTLIGLTVLLPVKRNLDQMQWRRELMRVQAGRMGEQETAYGQFHAALASDDPILLQRLAYYQLHLKPAGTEPLLPPPALSSRSATPADSGSQWQHTPTIEALLHRPLPWEGAGRRPPQPPDSRLNRLTRGPKRLVIMAIGLVFVYVGMLLPIDRGEAQQAEAAPG